MLKCKCTESRVIFVLLGREDLILTYFCVAVTHGFKGVLPLSSMHFEEPLYVFPSLRDHVRDSPGSQSTIAIATKKRYK